MLRRSTGGISICLSSARWRRAPSRLAHRHRRCSASIDASLGPQSISRARSCVSLTLPRHMAAPLPVLHRGFGETLRRDAWWLQPLVVFTILGGFVVYATWAAFQNAHYAYGPYLSPFYSPVIFSDSPETMRLAWFGAKPGWWPAFLPFSPALIILPFPGLFRFTCYYYRGAYYKAFWADPPNCAVGEPRSSYLGERYFPLVLQNIHRYFLYIALLFLVILSYDVWKALWFPRAGGGTEFGVGLGTLVLLANVVFLS